MAATIGVIEFSGIAKGIEACDIMLKAAKIDIIKSATVCPGKYIVVFSGNTSDVETALSLGKANSLRQVVDCLVIPNAKQDLIDALKGGTVRGDEHTIGVMEFYSITGAIKGADIASKSASIKLLCVKTGYQIGGKGVVIIAGETSAVRSGIELAAAGSELLIGSTVITKPPKQLLQALEDNLCI